MISIAGSRGLRLRPGPLTGIGCVWLGQAALVLGYLRYVQGHGGLGMLMHCTLLVALEAVCVLPLAWTGSKASASFREWMPLAAVLATAEFALLLAYGIMLGAYFTWGALPNREVAGLFLRQMKELLPLLGVEPRVLLGSLPLAWMGLVWLYRPLSKSLLRRMATPSTVLQAESGGGPGRGPLRGRLLIFLGCLGACYFPTRAHWSIREPLHLLFLASPSPYAQMIPEGLIGGVVTESQAPLPSFHVSPKGRNLILITVDALRSDQMGVYGSPYDDTPYLSKLLSSGKMRRIDSAYSICTFSFCGLTGIQSSASWHELNSSPVLLADVLHRFGYATRYLLGGDHTHFSTLRRFYGFHLDEYQDGSTAGTGHVNDDEVVFSRLKGVSWEPGRPTFLAIHLMSVHALGLRQPRYLRWSPWKISPGELLTGRSVAERYANNYRNGILQADDMIRQIFEVLQQRKVLENSLIMITADHGESLGERDHFGHGREPYESTVRIPLLIYDPLPTVYPARRLVSQIDIGPTLLRAIGAPVPSAWSGIPLQTESSRNEIEIASAEVSGIVAGWGEERYKYLRNRKTGAESLFSLRTDPGEVHDVADSFAAREILRTMRALHEQLIGGHPPHS